jgi:hypothetical protein
MTAQILDTFLFNGEQYSVINITGDLVSPEQFGMTPVMLHTACWRGFYATYEFTENALYLKALTLREENENYVSIGGIKPTIEDGEATYLNLHELIQFTGQVRLAKGFIEKYYIHMGYQEPIAFRTVLDLTLKDGMVVEIKDLSEEVMHLRGETLLQQTLSDAENQLYVFFKKNLPEDSSWEIYIKPYLNGLRPSFVLLHPLNGIAVFEVLDWCWELDNFFVGDNQVFPLEKQNPVKKIDLYKKEIYNLYCPRLAERTGLGAIVAGIVIPFATQEEITKAFKPFRTQLNMERYPHLYPVIGEDTLLNGKLHHVLPNWNRQDTRMSKDIAADLRSWLIEPSFSKDNSIRPELSDKRQLEFIRTRTKTGYRRIKGAAGSGKSVVLAARAIELAATGKNVLVCTYNITLINYLRNLSERWSNGTSESNAITWLNFHFLCKRIAIQADKNDEYADLWTDGDANKVLDKGMANLILSILKDTNEIPLYDAILVDEGQDFHLEWWAVLRALVKDDGEMVLVADKTQDIYGTASAWTDEKMLNSGFRGDWSSLDVSYRLPPKLIKIAQKFAEEFLPAESRQVPKPLQDELPGMYSPTIIKWQQVPLDSFLSQCTVCESIPKNSEIDVCSYYMDALLCKKTIQSILDMMKKIDAPAEQLAIADITVIVDRTELGIKISEDLRKLNIRCIDTFEPKNDPNHIGRRKKLSFSMEFGKVKVTTIQSFKGWESRLIILVISKAESARDFASIYTGLTRLKRCEFEVSDATSNLNVVCNVKKLEQFGMSCEKEILFERI